MLILGLSEKSQALCYRTEPKYQEKSVPIPAYELGKVLWGTATLDTEKTVPP